MIGHQVGNGYVDLMTDAADDRDRRFKNSSGNDFLVKRPEVFEAAAAATDDHRFNYQAATQSQAIQQVDGIRNFLGGAVALHTHRDDHDFDRWPAPREHFQHVADRRPGWRW